MQVRNHPPVAHVTTSSCKPTISLRGQTTMCTDRLRKVDPPLERILRPSIETLRPNCAAGGPFGIEGVRMLWLRVGCGWKTRGQCFDAWSPSCEPGCGRGPASESRIQVRSSGQHSLWGGHELTKSVAGDFCSICMRSPRRFWRATDASAFCCRGAARRKRGAAPRTLLPPWQARAGRKAPGPARKASANKPGEMCEERGRSGHESGARTKLKDPD